MRIFSGLALVLMFTFVLAANANAEVVKDMAGWQGTRWGMSPAQIKKLKPDFTIGKDRLGSTAGRLPDENIVHTSFEVDLGFAGVGSMLMHRAGSTEPDPPAPPESEWKLAEVRLSGSPDACYRVNEPLIAKYGQPTKVDGDGHLTLWIMPTTTIRLIHYAYICVIVYRPTPKGDGL